VARTIGFVLSLLPLMLSGCADGTADHAPTTGGSKSVSINPTGSAAPTTVTGVLAPYVEGATAVTYDLAIAPTGGELRATLTPAEGGLTVELAAQRLLPNRGYGAHVHTKPCGRTGVVAGPHYQHTPDPAASASPPSVDPSYANPDNEVWLDFTTDAAGAARSTASHRWTFTTEPRSIVLHAERTKTATGQAGTAGARVACLTLPPSR
jgi:Cu-Zn family superoxide dismutase